MIIVECKALKCIWNEDGCCLKSIVVKDESDMVLLPCSGDKESIESKEQGNG